MASPRSFADHLSLSLSSKTPVQGILESKMAQGIDFTVYKGSPSGKIIESSTHKDGLGPNDVLIRITHSGVCGTDEHMKKKDMVLGHEGAGIVQEVGKDVKAYKV